MIIFRDVSYTYPGATRPVLRHVNFHLPEATFALVVGRSGAGKSTLLRCVNGLVPHFSGGTFAGRLAVAGLDPLYATPRVMSRWVGFVFQNPEAQFVLDRVEDEIAFALENAAMPRQEMRVRVEEVLDLLDLAALRERKLETLSGGERQRVAIAAALAFRPRVLVLDEPTSQLDPQSAEDVLNALVRLNHDLGLTVLLAEHRLERVLQYADRVIALPDASDGAEGVLCGATREVLPQLGLLPPLVALAKQLDWQPLPLTIKEGLHFSRPLAERLPPVPPAIALPRHNRVGLALQRVGVRYEQQPILRDVSLEVRRGEILVLMGRNGSGKTTLLKTLVGLVRPESGRIWVDGREVTGEDVTAICQRVGYLPQEADALLFADTVRQELAVTLRNHGLPEQDEVIDPLLAQLGLSAHAGRYPRDLSVGERQRVALGAITVTRPVALLLDEPTRGLDYAAKEALSALLRGWRDAGMAILVVTHDVEFAARTADRVALLSQGELIAEGVPAEVLSASPLFAPQIARLFPGRGWLTVEDSLRGLRVATQP
ncbi:MAG: ABC transporter [Ardenticatenia bacterium]|jgi:energy-coupling factor transport system ATP-binding protein|nr:MAG: ABC transporter [Ardenticatenia bacterium]